MMYNDVVIYDNDVDIFTMTKMYFCYKWPYLSIMGESLQ